MSDPEEKSNRGSVAAGLGIGCLIQILVLAIALALLSLPSARNGYETKLIGLLGIIQLIFIVPAVVYASKRQQSRTVQGLIIIACIGFLIGGICGLIILT